MTLTKAQRVWAQTVGDSHINRVLANPDVMDKLLIWREQDPRFIRRSDLRRSKMQRQFTIELRVDYADNAKNEAMRVALAAAARHVFATAALLADAVKPQIAIFSDDFYSGHEQIELMEDTIAAGKQAISATGGDDSISTELVEALAAHNSGG